MKKLTYYLIISIFTLSFCQPRFNSTSNLTIDSLSGAFADPPISSRPKGFWCWINGNVDLDRITVELQESKANGMAGYDIWDVSPISDIADKVPAGPPFMGTESVEAIVHAIKEATLLDMEIGIMVASSWNSGGSWVKPEHSVQGILDTSVIVHGDQKISMEFPFPALPASANNNKWNQLLIQKDTDGRPVFYKEVAILAIPNKTTIDSNEIINLTDRLKNDRLEWQVPEGDWRITRYICTSLGIPLKRPSTNSKGLQIDHMSKEAQQAHLQFFIDKLQPHLGDLSKTALKYLYNDSYEIKGPVWTPKMHEEFKTRRGYDLIPFLPVLKGTIVQSKEISDRFMYDYRKTLSDLIIEHQYKYGVELCKQYGIGFHAEAGGPGPPVHPYVPVESVRASGSVTVPRGEFWHKYPKYDDEGFDSHVFLKGVASAAHLYDQTYVEAESFTSLLHWQESWQDLKPTADEAFCEGLNRIVFHTSTHSPDKFGSPGYVYGFGTHMNTRQPWWPKARAWIDYLARNSYMLQQGNFVGDILYYYGDQAPNFAKQRHVDPSLGFGFDYDVINTEKILELKVKEGKMTLPHGQEYALLVLPEQCTMPLSVLEKIKNLLIQGALVVGPKPLKTPGLLNYKENERNLKVLADNLWDGRAEKTSEHNKIGKGKLYWGKTQREILNENAIYPDFSFKGQDDSTSINFIHRKTETTDIYFVRNRRNDHVVAECVFRVKDMAPEIWIPETGERFELPVYSNEGDSTRVALSFVPYDAYFIVFTPENDVCIQEVKKDGQRIFPSKGPHAEIMGYQAKTGSFTAPGEYIFINRENKVHNKTVKPSGIQTIDGEWQLTFPPGLKAPPGVSFETLQSWTESDVDGIKYFSGIASYEIDFEIVPVTVEKKYMLDLGDVRELAEVWLNGDSLGIVWHKPFELEITNHIQKGKNKLIIKVANEWNNRLVGDGKLPESERVTNSNIINGPKAWGNPWKEVSLKPAGLLGPVTITDYY